MDSHKTIGKEPIFSIKQNTSNFDVIMKILNKLRKNFNWWRKNVFIVKNKIRDNMYKHEIFTDVSMSGWGAVCRGKTADGL